MATDDATLVGTAEACALLGVKPETLYAYVSRGLLQRRRADGRRGSLFDPAEIDRLATRGRQRAARRGRELRIASAITRVEPDGHRYRGHDPRRLARTA